LVKGDFSVRGYIEVKIGNMTYADPQVNLIVVSNDVVRDQFFEYALNHEIIHIVLDRLEGLETSKALDNLCRGRLFLIPRHVPKIYKTFYFGVPYL